LLETSLNLSRFFILILAITLPVAVAFTVGGIPVSASSCNVLIGSFVTGSYYSNPNVALIVPLLVQCSAAGGQLAAEGNALEVSTGAVLGSSNTTLLWSPGSTISIYRGQLVFTLPSTEEWHRVKVLLAVFHVGQSASPLVTTAETAAIDPNTKYVNFVSCFNDYACDGTYNYCQSSGNNGTMQCVGYLEQNQNGCLELVIPVYSPYGFLSYQYYTLQGLSSIPIPMGNWAIVNGQLHQGYNAATTGAACPGNYLTVTSISP
jgi:hypothetical protein